MQREGVQDENAPAAGSGSFLRGRRGARFAAQALAVALILASVLAANKEPEKAIAIARLIPAAKISNEELELLKFHLTNQM